MNIFSWIVGGVVALLAILLGIERTKVIKRDNTISKQKDEIGALEKTKEATKAESKVAKEVAQEIVKQKDKEVKVEKEIKTKDTKEIIDIANTLVDDFNKL